MPQNETITLTILAKDLASGNIGGFIGKLDQLAKRGGLAGSIAQGVGLSIGTMINPIALVTRGIGAMTDFLGDSITKAGEEQVGIEKLGQSLKDNIPAWDGNTDAIERTIKAREQLAFTDGEQREALAQLIVRTHDVTRALDLERTSMDFARLKGISLAAATTLIGKAYGGSYTALNKMGFAIKAGSTATEALAQIQKASAGQAETYSKTLAGAQGKLATAFEDLQESIGAVVTGPLTDFVSGLSDIISGGPPAEGAIGDLTDKYWALAKAKQAVAAAPDGWPVQGDKTWIGLLAVQEHLDDFYNVLGYTLPDASRKLFAEFGDGLDLTEHQMFDLVHAGQDAGLTFDEIHQDLVAQSSAVANSGKAVQRYGGIWQETAAVVVDSAAESRAAYTAMAQANIEGDNRIRKANADLEASYLELGDNFHDTLKQMKDDATTGLADIRFAMKHDGSKIKKQLEADMKDAVQLRNQAFKAGNTRALAIADAYIADLKSKIANLNMTTTITSVWDNRIGGGPHVSGPHGGGRARGGPVVAGETYTVGEHGPETLVMGNQNGAVVPGTGHTFVYAPQFSTASEAEARAFAAKIGPHITRWQRGG